QAALSGGDYGRYLAVSHPNWPLPGWTRGAYYAWTFTGAPAAANEALISNKAAVAPWAEAPIVEWWFLTNDGELLTPDPTLSLLDDTLPIPQAHWEIGGMTFDATLVSQFDGGGVHWQLAAQNNGTESAEGTLLAIVRPLAISNEMRPIYAAGFNRRGALWVNGSSFLTASETPDQFGVAVLSEMMAGLMNGRLPTTRYLDCVPDGMGTAVLAFPLSLSLNAQKNISLAFPSDLSAPLNELPDPRRVDEALAQTQSAWRDELGTPDIEIPDGFIMNAYKASLGYLLIALDPDGPHPGPLNHDALWVRDAAYIGETLISLGRADIVTGYLPSLTAHQREDGYVPAVIDADGPWDKEEWDAQGQLIFLIAELYR
ncbi:MAG: hypothetical protein GY803_17070, partial [Chloroflexi bacterium]|nr:hypothetical protein [Chloroflexota bacterium]